MTIQERRRELGMSLGDLARKADLDTSMVSGLEYGRGNPPDSTIESLAAALEWTVDQVRAGIPTRDAAIEDRMAKLSVAISGVVAEAKRLGLKKGHGGQGEMKCPVCANGTLRFSVASINGHIWGACSDPDCVRWMQ